MGNETVIIDPHGDVRLKVGRGETEGSQITFQVCSRALARSSKVFDTMLYGKFAESRVNSAESEGDWTVELPEQELEGMKIFLDIVHANLRGIPRIISVDELYGLTNLTNYFDATPMLAPWAGTWLSSVDEIAKDANQLMPKLLWVAWELGCKSVFVTTCNRILMETTGPWHLTEPEDLNTPSDLMERIHTIREHTAKSLLGVFNNLIEDLLIVDEKPRWCRHASYMGPHRCESMILGSMTFCLARAGLWPLPEPDELEYSLVGLYRKLTSLVIHDIGQVGDHQPMTDHRECNPRSFLLEQIKRIMDEIPSPLTESHMRHLSKQAANFSDGAYPGRHAS
ncbi:hypothetical protein HJFPF1_13308 [Paramyrothecium foliicola]|nr:hypothetical protein HJFPF1_13308 [Paramyrothecium foliicola]